MRHYGEKLAAAFAEGFEGAGDEAKRKADTLQLKLPLVKLEMYSSVL